MVLNERKLKILQAIINDYISTAEPIGSRTIAKKYDIGLSSATIRNEMSDLEEMGLIIQPHASAGRIPSDKGYRLYVDNLMNCKELSKEQYSFIYNMISENIHNMDYLMQETARAISYLTQYTAFVSEPKERKIIVKHLQLIPFDDSSIVLVLVTNSKVVRNYPIKLAEVPTFEVLSNMSLILNHLFDGISLNDMDIGEIKSTLQQMGQEGKLLLSIIDSIIEAILLESDVDVFTSGVRNILAFPEFSDLDKAKGVFQALEEKEILITLLGSDASEEMKIIIGNENAIEQMKDCSIIKAGYQLGEQLYGTIGILGPTRMDYAQVVAILHSVEKNLNKALRALRGG